MKNIAKLLVVLVVLNMFLGTVVFAVDDVEDPPGGGKVAPMTQIK